MVTWTDPPRPIYAQTNASSGGKQGRTIGLRLRRSSRASRSEATDCDSWSKERAKNKGPDPLRRTLRFVQTHLCLYTHEETPARELRRDGAADVPLGSRIAESECGCNCGKLSWAGVR